MPLSKAKDKERKRKARLLAAVQPVSNLSAAAPVQPKPMTDALACSNAKFKKWRLGK